MIKTQVQLPDELYYTAKAIAEQREWSLAEVIRRGLEHMAQTYPVTKNTKPWALPVLTAEVFAANFDELDLSALVQNDEVRDIK
jgi:hypothetical protein